ncbi:hypothetical protein Pmani_014933 [Petrolisthes manimaculis]|uniref:Uncharacterized protein n=1 Tax=Petrolisthes manimaculis TaxID=1843537 RepID=A0AAE1PRY6_9EUCA|nr:hypothetical protein Pmani_014933 [Petrolisthes manimaculis]
MDKLYHFVFPGLLRLQQIFQTIRPARASFQVRVVRRVESAQDALNFLRSLERSDRWSKKYVVLDCRTEMAKSTIVGHVGDVQMGRRNYHYLLSGLPPPLPSFLYGLPLAPVPNCHLVMEIGHSLHAVEAHLLPAPPTSSTIGLCWRGSVVLVVEWGKVMIVKGLGEGR